MTLGISWYSIHVFQHIFNWNLTHNYNNFVKWYPYLCSCLLKGKKSSNLVYSDIICKSHSFIYFHKIGFEKLKKKFLKEKKNSTWVNLSTYRVILDVQLQFSWLHFTQIFYWVSTVRQHFMDRNTNKENFLYKKVKLLSLDLKAFHTTVLTELSRITGTNLHQWPGASVKPSFFWIFKYTLNLHTPHIFF